jgi:hypothetical protein
VATSRTAITLRVDVPEEQLSGLGSNRIGEEQELEVLVAAPNTQARRAYVQEEYDELSVPGRVRLVKVAVVDPSPLPRYLPTSSRIRLRGMLAGWPGENPPPFEGPCCPP